MNSYQSQQLFNDINSIIGFTTSIIFLGLVVGMVRPMGKFFEPPLRPEKHLPRPVVKEVIVPGGSYWKCVSCDKELPPGTKVFKAGKEVYCSIPCIKLPEHHSSITKTFSMSDEPQTPKQARYITILCVKLGIKEPLEEGVRTRGEAGRLIRELEAEAKALPEHRSPTLQQFIDVELAKLVSTYGYPPNGISFEGRDVLDSGIGGHLGGFIFLANDLKDYWVYDKEKAKVLIKYTIAHEYSHLMVLYKGVEKYLPKDIEEKDKEEYLEGIADGFAAKWIGFTVEDIDKILKVLDEFGRFRGEE